MVGMRVILAGTGISAVRDTIWESTLLILLSQLQLSEVYSWLFYNFVIHYVENDYGKMIFPSDRICYSFLVESLFISRVKTIVTGLHYFHPKMHSPLSVLECGFLVHWYKHLSDEFEIFE